MDIFEKIEVKENLPPYILFKLPIVMSLKNPHQIEDIDFSTATGGLELNRKAITGNVCH